MGIPAKRGQATASNPNLPDKASSDIVQLEKRRIRPHLARLLVVKHDAKRRRDGPRRPRLVVDASNRRTPPDANTSPLAHRRRRLVRPSLPRRPRTFAHLRHSLELGHR